MKKFILLILFFVTLCKSYGAVVSLSGLTNVCHGTKVIYHVSDPLGSSVTSHNWLVTGGYFVDNAGNNLGELLSVSTNVSYSVNVFWSGNNGTSGTVTVAPGGGTGGGDPFGVTKVVNIGAQTPVISTSGEALCSNYVPVSASSINSNVINWSVDGGTYSIVNQNNIEVHPNNNGNGSGYTYVTATASNSGCGGSVSSTKAIPVGNLSIPVVNFIHFDGLIYTDCETIFSADLSNCANDFTWSCSNPDATIDEHNGRFLTSTLGRYTVSVTACNPAGCASKSITFIVKFPCPGGTKSAQIPTSLTNGQLKVVEGQNNKSIEIFPCPTTGILNIMLPYSAEKLDIKVFNIIGGIVFSQKYNETMAGIKVIDLSNNPKGTYLVKITTSDMIQEGKIIIQ